MASDCLCHGGHLPKGQGLPDVLLMDDCGMTPGARHSPPSAPAVSLIAGLLVAPANDNSCPEPQGRF